MSSSLGLDQYRESGGQGDLTRRKAVNDFMTRPVIGILMIFPFQIGVTPELVDKVFGSRKAAGRLPPAD